MIIPPEAIMPGPAMDGTWYVVRTSLPFWRTRTDPAISYTPLPDGRVTDTVTYRRSGRDKIVVGIDTPVDGGWVWRGLGPVTRRTTSNWRFVAGGDQDWAVSYFARTLFTPFGIDIVWRSPQPTEGEVAVVTALLPRIPEAAPFVDRLFAPTHHRESDPAP